MAAHSSSLAWRIPWTKEPYRLQFMGSQRGTWLSKSTARISDRRLISKYLRNSYSSNKLNLEKAEEPEVKLPTFAESEKKQGKSRKASTSVSLTTVKTLTVWVTTNCGKFLKRWEYQTILPVSRETCLQVKK